VIRWYKKYREILNSDLIHLRRPDGRDWDGMVHVNPQLKTRALLTLYNPTPEKIVRKIKVPLYYAGLTNRTVVREQEGPPRSYRLNRKYEIELPVILPPQSYTWFTME
jgi:hypothetical protein